MWQPASVRAPCARSLCLSGPCPCPSVSRFLSRVARLKKNWARVPWAFPSPSARGPFDRRGSRGASNPAIAKNKRAPGAEKKDARCFADAQAWESSVDARARGHWEHFSFFVWLEMRFPCLARNEACKLAPLLAYPPQHLRQKGFGITALRSGSARCNSNSSSSRGSQSTSGVSGSSSGIPGPEQTQGR